MSFMRVALLVAFVAPGLLVACGDDDDGRTGGTDSGTGTEMDAATGGEDASMAVTD